MSSYVIAGLGNPGVEYAETRHNIGFMVIDKLALSYDSSFKSGFKGEYTCLNIGGKRTFLIKPMTFMNLSGESVSAICRYYKVKLDNLLIIHDELDFAFGKFKYSPKGGAAGHNGVSSIIDHMGTNVFPRLRMGIGGLTRSAIRGHTVSYVMGRFTADEKSLLPEFIDLASESVTHFIRNGLQSVMQNFNRVK